ncbi:EscV/YscV/HrcV family type III secretion system export apparatus protein [Chromobacterium piscinae]|uniref:EscV/YscV/HrcV family type III secretion system export apparatus protein n=1 Tax=Chromobacterium piscinae TaxID=686831 RepID=A0ABV0H8U7_9NEIS
MNALLIGVRSRPELLILLLMVTIIAMLIVPLPTYLVDFLIGLNIVISMLIFIGSFYVERILNFSTFPSILLITTLFRLALSISTSRLILVDADAGAIIESFGQFVIGDSLVVGVVVFAIVTVVQFIVITKGSERVAEVAARFSLDGLPGKQMSIDADVRAGIVDSDGACERRSVLERESQLYGSFDGAMKFIKGDAIAGIIIIFVNFIGGMAVGVSQLGMEMSTALSTYTMLTIGDGLVAQIPALLISVSAGLIVTRVNGDSDNMGRNIIAQLLGKPSVLIITAGLSLVVGLLPGFPLPVFFILSALLAGLFYFRQSKTTNNAAIVNSKSETRPVQASAEDESGLSLITQLDQATAETIPFILLVPTVCHAELSAKQLTERLRSQYFIDYGVRLPDIVLRAADYLANETVVLLVNEIRAEEWEIHFNRMRVINYSDEIEQLGVPVYEAGQAFWVGNEHKETLKKLGYQLRLSSDEIYQCLAASLSRHVTEYFGVQETKQLLDQLEAKFPDLLKEVLRHATVQRLSEVLQRLLCERISVRNLKLIIETLAYWAPREKDVVNLVEHVRGALSRYICHKFAVNNQLRALVLSAETEDVIRHGIRQTSAGAFLNLEPAQTDMLIDTFKAALSNIYFSPKDLVLLSSVDVRRYIKKFLEPHFRELEVLSFGEITDTVTVDIIKTI